MKLAIIIGILMLTLMGIATAETCYTAISVPQADKYYWKAVTYSGINDGNYADYLTKAGTLISPTGLGAGYQYTVRIDADCFDHYILSNLYTTGITSDQINIQKKDQDYYTQNYIQNKLYTLSIPAHDDLVSTKLVSQITTGYIDGTDYLALPGSFTAAGSHPAIEEMIANGLCNKNIKITSQLDKIKLAIWNRVTPTDTEISCTEQNIVDCVLNQEKGTDKDYAATTMVLARLCGIPTRIAYGISEGTFDGVDLKFAREKQHYWIEYYDGDWFNQEELEGGAGLPSSIETNCQDGIDNDNNGLIDCFDPSCTTDAVCNNWFTTTMFKNSYSTDVTKLPNPYNVNNLTLGNEFGSITWSQQHLDLRGLQLESVVSIGPNQLRIADTATTLNKSGVGKLNKLLATPIKVLRNNENCTQCVITSISNSSAIFIVPGTGIYTLQFPNITTNATNIAPPTTSLTIQAKILNFIKNLWTGTTTSTKIIAAIIIIGIIWLIRRRKKKQQYGYRY